MVEIEGLEQLVARCRHGDLDAWTEVVRRFQAAGQAMAWAHVGDWATAADVTQEAFLLAYRHLASLEDDAAFPGWFSRIVRTACDRETRRRRHPTVELDAAAVTTTVPTESVDVEFDRQRLHRAIEGLPVHQRSVIALHYLAELSYAEVAEFLGISTAAAKKRALTGRARLKDLLPMTPDTVRPAPPRDIADDVLLFLSIRQGDRARVADLLRRKPDLVHATEQWSWADSLALGLQNAEHGTPLIRAVQTGDIELVRLIIEAGASVRHACECDGGESALWTAALLGDDDMVDYLLSEGADPNATAFAGSTPLHIATQRGHRTIARRLVEAGADTTARDSGGRTPGEWEAVSPTGPDDVRGGVFLPTGIRAVDLFAPICRGDVQSWPPAAELGQFATLWAIVDGLPTAALWICGFETGPYDHAGMSQSLAQTGLTGSVSLARRTKASGQQREEFENSVRRILDSPGDKIVVVLAAADHGHDVTVAAARLAADPQVVATFVVEPQTHFEEPGRDVPEGFHAQVAFDARRGFAGLWPAVEGRRTLARRYPDPHHEALADKARAVLERYDELDPDLSHVQDNVAAAEGDRRRGAALHRYLAQPFNRWEYATGQPGERTDSERLLEDVAHIIDA